MKHGRTPYILYFVVCILYLVPLEAQDVNKIIKQVQKTYDRMDNFSATFVQIETYGLTGTTTETEGKIYVKDGEKYRFETEDQVVVTDGKTVWTYNFISKQLLIDNVREGSGALLPRDLLFKYPKNHYASLVGREKADGKTVFVLKLDPKENVHGYVKSLKLWVLDDKWHVLKMETTDFNDNLSVFEIKDIDSETELSGSLFEYMPDDDAQIVDMR